MTSRTYELIELSDVKAFHFKCTECGASVNIPLDGFKRKPPQCPSCGESWEKSTVQTPTYAYVSNLFKAIDSLNSELREKVGFTFSLEISARAASGKD